MLTIVNNPAIILFLQMCSVSITLLHNDPTVLPQTLHTRTDPLFSCVHVFCDLSFIEYLSLYYLFVLFKNNNVIAWKLQVIVTSSLTEKRFLGKKMSIIMQKHCFSLPDIRATMTLFLYARQVGQKYISIYPVYINIYIYEYILG